MFRGAVFFLSSVCHALQLLAEDGGSKEQSRAVVGAEAEPCAAARLIFCRKRNRERRTVGKHHILHLPLERVAPGGGGKRQLFIQRVKLAVCVAGNVPSRRRRAVPERAVPIVPVKGRKGEIRVIVALRGGQEEIKVSRLRRGESKISLTIKLLI